MSPGKLRNIHAFLSMTVVIEDTVAIIVRALEQVGILDGVQPWPCYTLVTPSEEYLAILGIYICCAHTRVCFDSIT